MTLLWAVDHSISQYKLLHTGSQLMKISIQLVQLIISKISLDTIIINALPDLSDIVS